MAKEWFKLVVVGPTGKHMDARDVHGDLDRPDDFRDDLIAIAKRDTYLTSGGVGNWLPDFEGRLFRQREFDKGPYKGGWGTPERVIRYHR